MAYFLDYYNRKYNCRARALSDELMAALRKYHWPGNIRELENLIKRYVILGNEEVITAIWSPRAANFFNCRKFPWTANLAEEAHPAGRAGAGAQSHPESSAEPPLEPQAGGARIEHQLSGLAIQDS